MLVSMGAFGLGGGGGGGGMLSDAFDSIRQRVGGGVAATRTPIPVPSGSPDPGPALTQLLPPGNVPAAAIPAGPGPMLPPTSPATMAAAPAGVSILGQQVGIPTLVVAGGAAALGLYLLLRRRG